MTLQEHIDPQNGIWADVGEVTQMDMNLDLIMNQYGPDTFHNTAANNMAGDDKDNVAVDEKTNAADTSVRFTQLASKESRRPKLDATRRSSRVNAAGQRRHTTKRQQRHLAAIQRLWSGLSSASVKLGFILLMCLASALVSVQIERSSFFSRRETSVKVFLAAERHFHVRLVMLSLLNAGSVSTTTSEVAFWQFQARSSLRFLTDVQQVLLFGGQLTLSDYSDQYTKVGTFVLEASSTPFPKRQQIMFENACELLDSDSSRTLCETSYNGLFRRGLQNAITELTSRSYSVLRLAETQPWPRTQASIAAILASQDVRFISDVASNTLKSLLDIASELYIDELDDRLEAFKYAGNVVLCVSIVFILIIGVLVGASIVFQLISSIKRSHMLLLSLPPQMVTEEVEDIIDKLVGNATRKRRSN